MATAAKLVEGLHGTKSTTYVSFVCQRCYQPLKIDNSLYTLDLDSCLELENTLSTVYPNETRDFKRDEGCTTKSPNLVTRVVPPARLPSSPSVDGNGFTLLGETGSGINTDNLSQRLKVSAELFDIMSGNTEIDHPLCEECTDTLLDELDSQLNITEKELESYKGLLTVLESNVNDDDSALDKQIKERQLEEETLLKELEVLEQQHEKVIKDKEAMIDEEKELMEKEELYWREYCKHQKSLMDFEDGRASVCCQLQYVECQLDKLRKTNVFNSTFHIWHKGHFGTINNFRLGRLPSVPVEWSEINSAWGQTVLLLHSLAKKIGITFKRYRLVPYGNHSFLECLDDKSKELPLYGSGGFRFFWDTKFDQAMVAFLDCLQQFKEEVEKGDSKFYLPYRMEKGKIYDSRGSGAYSVKIQFNSEEHWTKALKFILTNLKWGLAWVSSQFADKST